MPTNELNVTIVKDGDLPPPPDGPNIWYYGGSSAKTDDYVNNDNYSGDYQAGDKITVPRAGTITKLRLKFSSVNSTFANLRVGLYYNKGGAWTLHECISTSYGGSGWTGELNFASGYTVGANETVWIIYHADAAIDPVHETTSGGHYSGTPLAGCAATYAIKNDYQYGVSVYVD